MKKVVVGVSRALSPHPVGNAFEEQLFFTYDGMGRQTNAAIRATHAACASAPAGASTGAQAFCGLECVTLLLQGGLRVRDSAGHDHTLAAGDVLWNGAGRGLLREERPSPGAPLEQVSLWINLPAQYKLTEPHCQLIRSASIPALSLPGETGSLRLIAGEWQGQLGPAETVQSLQLWDLTLKAGQKTDLPLQNGWYAVLLTLTGTLRISHWLHPVGPLQTAMLDAFGDETGLHAEGDEDVRAILVSAQPLNEAISGQDGLVMNTPEQLAHMQQALAQGTFGALPALD